MSLSPGYTREGPFRRECEISGFWSGQDPVCYIPKKVPFTPLIQVIHSSPFILIQWRRHSSMLRRNQIKTEAVLFTLLHTDLWNQTNHKFRYCWPINIQSLFEVMANQQAKIGGSNLIFRWYFTSKFIKNKLKSQGTWGVIVSMGKSLAHNLIYECRRSLYWYVCGGPQIR